MRLLPTYANNDAGNLTRDGFFDAVTGTRYAVRVAQFDKGGQPEIRWVTAWDVCAFTTPGADTEPMAFLSRDFATFDDALTELDRIAALIEGKAPAQEWVAGAPPLIDGAWFLVMHQGEPVAVHCHTPNDLPWTDSAGNDYPSSEFTHHLPTPIQPPQES